MLVQRLDFGPGVREALRFTFERWNGNGYPAHAQGEAIPLAMRVVHLSHDMEAIGRLFSPEQRSTPRAIAATARTTRRSPTCSSRTAPPGSTGSARSSRGTPCSPLEPEPHRMLAGAELDDALTVVADFIDLKSPYMGGHSRRCAELAADAARVLGLAEEDVDHAPPRGARARLRHDRRAELDLGQARPAHAGGVRSGRASPDADRADAAPLAGSGRPEHRRVRAPREVRRVRLPQARARRRRRSRRVRPGGDGDLRGADHRASRPPAVLARRRGRRASPARVGGRARAAGQPRGARGRGARRAASAIGQAAASTRAGSPAARSTCCGSRPGDSRRARSPIGSTSRRRPPTTTSSTSTARSACRRGPPPRSGRCSTPSCSDGRRGSSRRRSGSSASLCDGSRVLARGCRTPCRSPPARDRDSRGKCCVVRVTAAWAACRRWALGQRRRWGRDLTPR